MPLGLACLILLLADHLGSTSLAPDAAGNPIGTFDYSPFGQTSASGTSADSVRPRYTGQRHDPVLDTYRFPARAYDPVTGRFLEVDPKRVNPSPYIYASNNPVNRVDPTGGADRPFILIEYDSFPSFLTSDQVSATVLRFVDLPMSFANAIVDMDTLKALNAAAAENWGSYAEMHPMEILRGPSGNIERNELAYFVFGPNSQREVSSGMFDSLKTLQTFDIGRRFHSEQSGPHYARLFHKNIVVHDTGDRARMANLLRELESSMEPFVRERGEASKYEPRPTKFSGLTREYAREAEIRMRRKLWASEPNSRLTRANESKITSICGAAD